MVWVLPLDNDNCNSAEKSPTIVPVLNTMFRLTVSPLPTIIGAVVPLILNIVGLFPARVIVLIVIESAFVLVKLNVCSGVVAFTSASKMSSFGLEDSMPWPLSIGGVPPAFSNLNNMIAPEPPY